MVQVSNDILMTKQKRQALADESRWEDVSVSKHVVLRTSLPMAAPRVPQLIVNPPSYDNVRCLKSFRDDGLTAHSVRG